MPLHYQARHLTKDFLVLVTQSVALGRNRLDIPESEPHEYLQLLELETGVGYPSDPERLSDIFGARPGSPNDVSAVALNPAPKPLRGSLFANRGLRTINEAVCRAPVSACQFDSAAKQ
jgi:hypothetical protein